MQWRVRVGSRVDLSKTVVRNCGGENRFFIFLQGEPGTVVAGGVHRSAKLSVDYAWRREVGSHPWGSDELWWWFANWVSAFGLCCLCLS